VHNIKAEVVKPNQALKLEALNKFVDRNGIMREAGEQWIFDQEGSFIPDIDEKIVDRIVGIILTDKKAIHVEALVNHSNKKAGEVWLVTSEDTDVYIPPVQVRIINNNVPIVTLNSRQYTYLNNPYDDNNIPQYGKKEMRKGEQSFFLKPFESIEEISNVIVITAEEAISVFALENFEDKHEENGKTSKVNRIAGERWLVVGPKEYWPPVQVRVEYPFKKAIFKIEGVFYLFKAEKLFLSIFFFFFLLFMLYRIF